MAITVEQLSHINEMYPNEEAYKLSLAANLTLSTFCSGSRLNMFSTHIEQAVMLEKPESPAMATAFEKVYGKYADSYRVANSDYLVIDVIPKYDNVGKNGRFNYLYVVQNMETKIYDVIEIKHYECLSEGLGYLRPYTSGDSYVPGSIIKKGSLLYKSNNHDEYGNYRYGKNLKVAFISLSENEEDGIVMRRGCAENLCFYSFNTYSIDLNRNQKLLNLYGDDVLYKCFPNIGEPIKEGILYARRTINYENVPSELTSRALRTILTSDEVCSADGYVADIDVFVNQEYIDENGMLSSDMSDFTNSGSNMQIYALYCEQVKYYRRIFEILDPIVMHPNRTTQYTFYLRWMYEHARNYLDTNNVLVNNNNTFDFAHIVITVYQKKHLNYGYKLTDRFGGKGVITAIFDDELMPRDEYGNVADIIVSPPSVIARANPGQLFENEYNFIAEIIKNRIKSLPTLQQKEALLFEFIDLVSPDEGNALRKFLHNKYLKEGSESVANFFKDLEETGIKIIEIPFGGTVSIENIDLLYRHFNIEPSRIIMGRDFKDNLTSHIINNEPLKTRKSGDFEYVEPAMTLDNPDMNTNPIGITPYDIKDENSTYAGYTNVIIPVRCKNAAVPSNYKQPNINSMQNLYYTAASVNYLSTLKENIKKSQENPYINCDGMTCVRAYINKNGNLVREYKSDTKIPIGVKYYMVLKQMPDEKFSARSLGSLNQVGLPNKPSKQVSQMSPYSKSAIRIGEMENDNLNTRIADGITHRWIAAQSTNPKIRSELNSALIKNGDPLKSPELPYSDDDIANDTPALLFHSYIYALGAEFEPIYEDEENLNNE